MHRPPFGLGEAGQIPSLAFKIFHNFTLMTPQSVSTPHSLPQFTCGELKPIKLLAELLPCSMHFPTSFFACN